MAVVRPCIPLLPATTNIILPLNLVLNLTSRSLIKPVMKVKWRGGGGEWNLTLWRRGIVATLYFLCLTSLRLGQPVNRALRFVTTVCL